jgi:hypothetical protein
MSECHCIIRHPKTEADRERVKEALERARRVNDSQGAMIAIAQLTGKCLADKELC